MEWVATNSEQLDRVALWILLPFQALFLTDVSNPFPWGPPCAGFKPRLTAGVAPLASAGAFELRAPFGGLGLCIWGGRLMGWP